MKLMCFRHLNKKIVGNQQEPNAFKMVNALEVLKKFDAYPKTLEDFRIKTFSGGTITVISSIVMILLFTSEIRDYLTPG